MDTLEKGWEENREDYLKKAYGAVRSKGEPVPLNEAVDRWEMLTEDASKHYLWRALGLFRVNGDLELEEDSGQKMLDIDSSVSMAELIEEELGLETGEGENVRKVEKDDYREFGDFEAPAVPLFIPWEHVDRHGYEVFPHESPGMRGFAAKDETSAGTEEIWIGFYNDEESKEGSTWINQVFRGMEVEGEEGFFSTEDVFTDRNRESYTDTIWESEPLKIRQRAYQVWDAAVEAVEEELPAQLEEYEDRWEKEAGELEALKREFRLMAGDDEYDEENPTYIEQIVHDYYEDGLHRDSKLLQPFLENIESTPYEEGDMNLDEATRGSQTSEGKKRRNQEYMSHYLDLVWQLSHEKYGEE